jgi:hypothetical protein
MANEKDLQKEVAVQEEVKKEKTKKPRAKKLTVAELKKQNRNLDAQTEHTVVVNGVEYKVKVDNVFRKTKQHKLLEDLILFMNEGSRRVELLDVATPYITLLMIKHFTDVEVSDDIDEAIETMNALVDLEIFGEIANLMPENELLKMYETINASIDRMNVNITELLKEAEELSKKVENKEVKEMLENGENE